MRKDKSPIFRDFSLYSVLKWNVIHNFYLQHRLYIVTSQRAQDGKRGTEELTVEKLEEQHPGQVTKVHRQYPQN